MDCWWWTGIEEVGGHGMAVVVGVFEIGLWARESKWRIYREHLSE